MAKNNRNIMSDFQIALYHLNASRGIINCGCKYDDLDAEFLYLACKRYIADYDKKMCNVL